MTILLRNEHFAPSAQRTTSASSPSSWPRSLRTPVPVPDRINPAPPCRSGCRLRRPAAQNHVRISSRFACIHNILESFFSFRSVTVSNGVSWCRAKSRSSTGSRAWRTFSRDGGRLALASIRTTSMSDLSNPNHLCLRAFLRFSCRTRLSSLQAPRVARLRLTLCSAV